MRSGRSGSILGFPFALAALLALSPLSADVFVQGAPRVGNGIPNGLGSTLGRIFLRLSGSWEEQAFDAPLDLFLGSGAVTVEPITCAAASTSPCERRGRGTAAVMGYPATPAASFLRLRLAGAVYLSPRLPAGLAGSSLEVAFEAALPASSQTPAGTPVRLQLAVPERAKTLAWGADPLRPPADRSYATGTGASLLLADASVISIPGSIRGEVIANDGNSLVIKLTEANLITSWDTIFEGPFRVLTDPAAAAAAGLPGGSFGIIEVNYSGIATFSAVSPLASSNDVELHITAARERRAFKRGDCNGDGLNVEDLITDVLFLLDFVFNSGEAPKCLAACDADGDGQVIGQVTDAVYLLQFQFQDGPPPPAPFPGCGTDIPPSSLSCASYPACPTR